jgi:hypothetical protein
MRDGPLGVEVSFRIDTFASRAPSPMPATGSSHAAVGARRRMIG